jgi:hypothetical protein
VKRQIKKAVASAKRNVKKAARAVEHAVIVDHDVKVQHAAPPVPTTTPYEVPHDSFDHRPFERAAETNFAGSPNDAILDNLAGLANRCDDWLAHGPGFNLENRLRARLSTPGLREWVKARMGS